MHDCEIETGQQYNGEGDLTLEKKEFERVALISDEINIQTSCADLHSWHKYNNLKRRRWTPFEHSYIDGVANMYQSFKREKVIIDSIVAVLSKYDTNGIR